MAALPPHRYLHRSQLPPERAVDIAILAEGYTAAEMDSFYVHAQRAADEILSYGPYKDRADRFNIIAVASPSAESGVSVPRLGGWKHTAFRSHFSTFYSDRYLTAPSVSLIHDALVNIPYEHIIVFGQHRRIWRRRNIQQLHPHGSAPPAYAPGGGA